MANKPTISQEAFVELYCIIGEAWLEDVWLNEHLLGQLQHVDDEGNISLSEAAQDKFNEITDKLDGFFRQFLKVEGDSDNG